MIDNTDPMEAFTDLADRIRKSAYADGWRDAMAAVAKAVGDLAPGEVQDAIGPRATPKLTTSAQSSNSKSKLTLGTTPYQIVQVLEANPGRTPAEIIEACKAAGHAAPDNSIRTNIHRLKERKVIVARHGKWYVN